MSSTVDEAGLEEKKRTDDAADERQKFALQALTPLDGRYSSRLSKVADHFSEFSLFSHRLRAICEKLGKKEVANHRKAIENIAHNFTVEECVAMKKIERVTNHDIKAVEYWLKDALVERIPEVKEHVELVHFALTSQDINNTSIPLMVKEAVFDTYLPALHSNVLQPLRELGLKWLDVPMLARTHGQAATPTRVGKEFLVFVERIEAQLKHIQNIPLCCKFGGATGGFNAHVVAYPSIDWCEFADEFCRNSLGLQRQQMTTQIEHYDQLGALFDTMKRINTILIDLCRDTWQYISMEYFTQKVVQNEVGSSAMPHKVNPIDFENAEGNFGVANSLFEHLSAKLPVSRLQRDLSDSTVLRVVGVPFGHTILSFSSLKKGLSKIMLNSTHIHDELERNFVVVSEAIQTVLRRVGFDKPYEALKALTRNTHTHITHNDFVVFVDGLNVSDEVKAELKVITPHNFVGMLPKSFIQQQQENTIQ